MVPQYQALARAIRRQQQQQQDPNDPQTDLLRSPFGHGRAIQAKYHARPASSHLRSAAYHPGHDKAHFENASWQRAMMYLAPESGGTGYSCAADAFAQAAVVVAVATVATMCILSVIGGFFCAPVLVFG